MKTLSCLVQNKTSSATTEITNANKKVRENVSTQIFLAALDDLSRHPFMAARYLGSARRWLLRN